MSRYATSEMKKTTTLVSYFKIEYFTITDGQFKNQSLEIQIHTIHLLTYS